MGRMKGISHPVVDYAATQLRLRFAWARTGEGADGRDRGASAVEWVIIAAIAVGIVAGVGALIMEALQSKADDVKACIDGVDLNNQQQC